MKKHFKISWFVLVIIFAFLIFDFSFSQVDPPQRINFRGRLTNASGVPFDGNISFTIEYYNAPTDGTRIATDTFTSVSVNNGIYTIQLGSGGADLNQIFSTYPNVWLQVIVNGEQLSPRTQLVSSGYAINSRYLRGYDWGNVPQATDIWVNETGDTMTGALNMGTDGAGQQIIFAAMDGVNEGGELILNGASTYADWYFDNYQGRIRLGTGGVTYFDMSTSRLQVPRIEDINNATYYLDPAGDTSAYLAGSTYSTIYYDINDTTYYLNPAGPTSANFGGSTYSTIYYDIDDSRYYVNPAGPTSAYFSGSTYSTIYYDINNTTYYVDPAGTTAAYLAGAVVIDGNTVIDDGAGWHRSYGDTGWRNGTYGGGWYMTNSTSISSYGGKQVSIDTATASSPSILAYNTGANSEVRGGDFRAHCSSGNTSFTYGVMGFCTGTQNGFGVYGFSATTTSYKAGGRFSHIWGGVAVVGVYSNGAIKMSGTGSIGEIIPTRNHGRITLICPESPEYWYIDYGTVELIDGKAYVELDPILLEISVIDENNPMRVFLHVNSTESFPVAVIKGKTGFELVERGGGKHSCSVDYTVVVKPKTNYGQGRFPQAPGPAFLNPQNDPPAARAKNQPDPSKIWKWPPDWEVYGYEPADYTPIGGIVEGGKYAGMVKISQTEFMSPDEYHKNHQNTQDNLHEPIK